MEGQIQTVEPTPKRGEANKEAHSQIGGCKILNPPNDDDIRREMFPGLVVTVLLAVAISRDEGAVPMTSGARPFHHHLTRAQNHLLCKLD